MDGLENGWYLKSNGHMTCDSCYQRIGPFKACSALEHGNVITFVHVVNGSEMPYTRYMPVSEYESVVAENEKLRELVEEAVDAASLDDVRDWSIGHRLRLIRQARELGIETDDV